MHFYRGHGYVYPECPGSRPSVGREDYIEPGVGLAGYRAGRGGPPARQRVERDDYIEPGVGPGRYGAGRAKLPSGPGAERDGYIEPGVVPGRYGAGDYQQARETTTLNRVSDLYAMELGRGAIRLRSPEK